MPETVWLQLFERKVSKAAHVNGTLSVVYLSPGQEWIMNKVFSEQGSNVTIAFFVRADEKPTVTDVSVENR